MVKFGAVVNFGGVVKCDIVIIEGLGGFGRFVGFENGVELDNGIVVMEVGGAVLSVVCVPGVGVTPLQFMVP